MLQIKSIHSARHMNDEYWEVGKEVFVDSDRKKKGTITEIKDSSLEFPDSIDFVYNIYVDGKIYLSIVNMPVKIYYESEELA